MCPAQSSSSEYLGKSSLLYLEAISNFLQTLSIRTLNAFREVCSFILNRLIIISKHCWASLFNVIILNSIGLNCLTYFHSNKECGLSLPRELHKKVHINNFIIRHDYSLYSVHSVPQTYTSYTKKPSNGILSRYAGLSYQRTGITAIPARNGCTVCVPHHPPLHGSLASSSRFHMDHTQLHRISCNRQVSVCRTWRRLHNPNGELSGEHSYGITH